MLSGFEDNLGMAKLDSTYTVIATMIGNEKADLLCGLFGGRRLRLPPLSETTAQPSQSKMARMRKKTIAPVESASVTQ